MVKKSGPRFLRILKREKRSLPVHLTDPEILEVSRKAASTQRQIADLERGEEDLKCEASAKKKQAERLDLERRRLESVVHLGSEEREIEVEVTADMRTRMVQEVRMDTGEVLSERPMTPDESQGILFADLAAGPREEGAEDKPIDLNPPPKSLPPARRPKPPETETNA